MGRNKQYRIPNIEEFKQGFKFQLLSIQKYRMIWLNFDMSLLKEKPMPWRTSKKWIDLEVDWKYPPNQIITTPLSNGGTFSTTGRFANFMAPWYVDKLEELIKEGKIRTWVV